MPRLAFLLLASLLAIVAAPADAQQSGGDPYVFVLDRDRLGRERPGYAWWLQPAVIRPTGTSVAGIPLTRINAELGSEAWCYANVLTPNSFVSPVRRLQEEIDASLAEADGDLFRASGAFTGGPVLDAYVGHYEACDSEIGAFLLIAERGPEHRIVHLHRFRDWGMLLWMDVREDVIRISSCFECGHKEVLVHDRRRNRFHWVNEGD